MKQHAPTLNALILGAFAATPAWAHEGHSLAGVAHWHSTDVLGFVAVAAVVVALAWFRGDK